MALPQPGAPVRRVHREVKLAMRAYELMLICDGGLEESEVAKIINQVTAEIQFKPTPAE